MITMKVKFERVAQGNVNTHYQMSHGLAKLGKLYVPNEIADNDANADVKEFEVEIPLEIE